MAVQRRAVDGMRDWLLARTAFQCVRGRCRVSRAVAVCLWLSVRVGPSSSCQVRCRRSLASRWFVLAHVLLFLFFPRDLSLLKRCVGTLVVTDLLWSLLRGGVENRSTFRQVCDPFGGLLQFVQTCDCIFRTG